MPRRHTSSCARATPGRARPVAPATPPLPAPRLFDMIAPGDTVTIVTPDDGPTVGRAVVLNQRDAHWVLRTRGGRRLEATPKNTLSVWKSPETIC